jgi:hypothetical protein
MCYVCTLVASPATSLAMQQLTSIYNKSRWNLVSCVTSQPHIWKIYVRKKLTAKYFVLEHSSRSPYA